jgi:gas vesicle protein
MKAFTALLTGVVAGAAIGTLLAPEKGSKTRAQIASSAQDFVETLKEKRDEGMEAIASLKDQVMTGMTKGNGHKRATATRRPVGTRTARKATTTTPKTA